MRVTLKSNEKLKKDNFHKLMEAIYGYKISWDEYKGAAIKEKGHQYIKELEKDMITEWVIPIEIDGDAFIGGAINWSIEPGYIYIRSFVINPSFRKTGLSSKILASQIGRLKAIFPEIPKVRIESTQESCMFWMKNGFKPTGVMCVDPRMGSRNIEMIYNI